LCFLRSSFANGGTPVRKAQEIKLLNITKFSIRWLAASLALALLSMSADLWQAISVDLCTSRRPGISVFGFIIPFPEARPLSPEPHVRKRIIAKLVPLSDARKRAAENSTDR
jgi:hypothetical protein